MEQRSSETCLLPSVLVFCVGIRHTVSLARGEGAGAPARIEDTAPVRAGD
jgi:hypothetical protein